MEQFVIIPDNNQHLMFRKFQDQLLKSSLKAGISCVPYYPLFIECPFLKGSEDISSLRISKEDKIKIIGNFVAIRFCAVIDKKETALYMKVLECIEKNKNDCTESQLEGIINEKHLQASCLPEKLSPFRLCRIDMEQNPHAREWKVLSEKWIKPVKQL